MHKKFNAQQIYLAPNGISGQGIPLSSDTLQEIEEQIHNYPNPTCPWIIFERINMGSKTYPILFIDRQKNTRINLQEVTR